MINLTREQFTTYPLSILWINFYIFLTTISLAEYNHNIELIVSIGFFVALAGFIDDRINLNPSTKILFLVFPSIYLILNGIQISDLGKYMIYWHNRIR